MRDLRLTITVRNNLLMRAIEGAGFDSVAAFCRAHGLDYQTTVKLVALKAAPINTRGGWMPTAIKLATALKALPEDLFPAAFLTRALERNRVEREISSDDVPSLGFGGVQSIAYDPEAATMRQEALSAMRDALGTLNPREVAVLSAIYGLETGEPQTLREVGNKMNVTQERVRQIQLRAERRLKSMQGLRGEKMKVARHLLSAEG
jgi:RNA polymerase primary sigma factor